MNLPIVTIVMTTWFTDTTRKKVAEDTLWSWRKNLKYQEELCLHVADDGSTIDWEPEKIWYGSTTFSRQEARGVGASLNKGFTEAFHHSPIVFYGVDDWKLEQEFDITPWVQLLLEREDVGIVRLGPPHPHLRGNIEPITKRWQGWALRFDRHGLVVGHRPELFHKRMIDHYGWFDEDVNACECERLYTVRYAEDVTGPDIVLALPHPWFHIDQAVLPSTSSVDPKDRQ